MRNFFILALAVLAPSCATVTQGTDQTVTVATSPNGAECGLERAGVRIATIAATPGPVSLKKSAEAVIVTCELDGYEPAKATLRSEFEGATLGNVLLGGIVGVMIDASSGAANKYPERISLTLHPIQFPSTAERDAFFAYEAAKVQTSTDAALAQIARVCPETDPTNCADAIALIEADRAKALASLDQQRLAARIAPPVAPAPATPLLTVAPPPPPTPLETEQAPELRAATIESEQPEDVDREEENLEAQKLESEEPVATPTEAVAAAPTPKKWDNSENVVMRINIIATQYTDTCEKDLGPGGEAISFDGRFVCGETAITLNLETDEYGNLRNGGVLMDIASGITRNVGLSGANWSYNGGSGLANVTLDRI